MNKVAVLLSGGIDSSVSALLLKNTGYNVIGLTGKMFDDENSDTIIKNASNVAKSLNIEHIVLNVEDVFKKNIISYFNNSYTNGLTPNPCIKCNKKIKWGSLLDFAINKLKCDYIATGHYAQIIKTNNIYKLIMAKDQKKDQLYYLFELDQNQLSKTLFPLSKLTKDEVRKIAQLNNLPSKSSKESQDICFIKKPLSTKKYLDQIIKTKPGDFILKKENKKIGTHLGQHLYTIGQRRGIGIAYETPLYVIEKDFQKNIIYLGEKKELDAQTVYIQNVTLQNPDFNKENFEALIKIRYNMDFKLGKINVDYTNKTSTIKFIDKVNSVCPGQACVFYDKEDISLIGGGWIL